MAYTTTHKKKSKKDNVARTQDDLSKMFFKSKMINDDKTTDQQDGSVGISPPLLETTGFLPLKSISRQLAL